VKTRSASAAVVAALIAVLVGVFVLRQAPSEGTPHVSVTDVYASETAGDASSMYMTFDNSGGSDDLVAVIVTGVGQVSIHDADMRPHDHLRLKGHHTTKLAPAGGHIMLESLSSPLRPGTQLDVRLMFKRSAPIEVTADVLSYDQINQKISS